MFAYYYTINWYNEVTNEEELREGITLAASKADAVSRIAASYGEDEICSIYLEIIAFDDDEGCIEIEELMRCNKFSSAVHHILESE